MSAILSDLPRVIDFRDPRRPGGAQGAPPPDLPAGTTLACWVSPREVVHLDAAAADYDGPGLTWDAVHWWIPIRDEPADVTHADAIDGRAGLAA